MEKVSFMETWIRNTKVDKYLFGTEVFEVDVRRDSLETKLASQKTELEYSMATSARKMDFVDIVDWHMAAQEDLFTRDWKRLNVKSSEVRKGPDESLVKVIIA